METLSVPFTEAVCRMYMKSLPGLATKLCTGEGAGMDAANQVLPRHPGTRESSSMVPFHSGMSLGLSEGPKTALEYSRIRI